MRKKLKIGLLIDNFQLPAWIILMIEQINSSEHSEIVLIVKKDNIISKKKSLFLKLWKNRYLLFYYLYVKVENLLFRPQPNAFQLKNLEKVVNCEVLNVKVKETNYGDDFLTEDVFKVKSFELDVLIRLGFRVLRGEVLNSSKYGIWSFHHGDSAINRGGPAGVWEVLGNWNETGVALQILSEGFGGDKLLGKSISVTDPLSINRSKHNCYWKAASFLPRQLKGLSLYGKHHFLDNLEKINAHPIFYDNKLFSTPSNFEVLKAIANNYTIATYRKLSRFIYLEQWILLFRLNQKEELSKSFFRFKRMIPPKDRFWADPFVIEKDNKYFIFIEEFLFNKNKGRISVITMTQDGQYDTPKVALEKDYHLSYPFIFEEGEQLFMVPESRSNNTIELYKCVEFPFKWKLAKILMQNIQAVDSTIFKKDNKYWLFTNIKENQWASTWDELFLFYTDDLFSGQWASHPMNPIVTDIKSSRSAGSIFTYKQSIYRPSQNCSKHYGYGMKINEVVVLTETDYKEETIQAIYPNWSKDIISTHTINHTKGLTVIDGLIKRRK